MNLKGKGTLILLFSILFSHYPIIAQENYEMTKLSDNLYQFYQKDFVNMFAIISDELNNVTILKAKL